MFDVYRTKSIKLNAEELDQDVMITYPDNSKLHVQGGNYLIHMKDGRVFPVEKDLFEILFEKEETNGRTE